MLRAASGESLDPYGFCDWFGGIVNNKMGLIKFKLKHILTALITQNFQLLISFFIYTNQP